MSEVVRVLRAVATNQVARLAPRAYLRLTGQTGRGDGDQESPEDIADYFLRCADDYLDFGHVPDAERAGFFAGKAIIEYGPGDFPGVALILLARGARRVWCVDRFPLVSLSEKNVGVFHALMARLGPAERERARAVLRDPQQPVLGFRDERLAYVVRPHGFSGLNAEADLAISRAVLEHVDDLPGTFADMLRALRPGGQAWHQADLKSHGLHRSNPLDFLAWTPWLWTLMYSQKGVPNRWRIDRYRGILQAMPVEQLRFEPTTLAAAEQVAAVRPQLAEPFRGVSDDDLSCLGFWVGFAKPTTVA